MGTRELKCWVGKKAPTNLDLKSKHTARKLKRELQHGIEQQDWYKQLKEYNIYGKTF